MTHKTLIEHKTDQFYKKFNSDKSISMKTLSVEFRPVALQRLMSLEIDKIRTLIGHFRMFSLSTFNLRATIRDRSIKEISNNMSPSIQTLIEEFEHVVFEKGELEYWDVSWLKTLFPLLVIQDSNSDVENRLHDKTNSLPKIKSYRLTICSKYDAGIAKEVWVSISKHIKTIKTNSTFRHL